MIKSPKNNIRYKEKKYFENKDRDLLKEVFKKDQIMALSRGSTPEARSEITRSDKTI